MLNTRKVINRLQAVAVVVVLAGIWLACTASAEYMRTMVRIHTIEVNHALTCSEGPNTSKS